LERQEVQSQLYPAPNGLHLLPCSLGDFLDCGSDAHRIVDASKTSLSLPQMQRHFQIRSLCPRAVQAVVNRRLVFTVWF
jgi:hypothetical protein